jgi:putative ATP-dependent endonuclease of OLD family
VKLDTVEVEGFRSVSSFPPLKISSPTLLTGHNDAGKSALLDAVRFLLNEYTLSDRDPSYKLPHETASPADSRERVGQTIVTGEFILSAQEQTDLSLSEKVRVRRRSEGGAAPLYEVEASVPDDERLQNLERLSLPQLKEYAKEFGLEAAGPNKPHFYEALRAHAESSPSTEGWSQASAAIVKALPPVLSFNPSGVTEAEETIRAALQSSYRAHEKDESLVGDIKKLELALETKVVKDAAMLRQHIMDTIPDLGTVTIIPAVSFSSGLKQTQVSITNPAGEAVHLGEAGAGRARRVSLAVWEFTAGLLENSADVVILYDEPDTHLDYSHQRNFMRLIDRQARLGHVRMLIATHSMNLIDGVDIADVVLLAHDESFRTVAHVLADDSEIGTHLGAVAASLGLRNTVLLHERLFVGVEGATEAAAFPVLFRLATGRQLEACGIAMWSCNNNEGALKFAAFLNEHGRDVVFLVDQDSKSNSKNIFSTKKLTEYGLSDAQHGLYLGDPNELEDLFDDSIWARVANLMWKKVDGTEWLEDEIGNLREGKFSSSLLELFKTGSETGPKNKQELMVTLALNLSDSSEIPASLNEAFNILIARANPQL